MLRRQICTVAVIGVGALALVSEAQGGTKVVAPPDSPYPYQAWADRARVPTPDLTIAVVEDDERCEGESSACTELGAATIWLDPWLSGGTRRDVRSTFLHELGHQFDYVMPEWARARFLALRRDSRAWREGPNAPNEQFAEAWALCAERGQRLGRVDEWGYGYEPSRRLHFRVCHLVRVAARYI